MWGQWNTRGPLFPNFGNCQQPILSLQNLQKSAEGRYDSEYTNQHIRQELEGLYTLQVCNLVFRKPDSALIAPIQNLGRCADALCRAFSCVKFASVV